MHSDQTAFTAQFGLHIVQTEIDELLRLEREVTETEVAEKRTRILSMFDTPDPGADPLTRKVTEEDLRFAARVAVALDKFVDHYELDALTYYYEGQPGWFVRT